MVDVVLAVAAHLWFKSHEPTSLTAVAATILTLSIPTTLLLLPHVDSCFVALCIAVGAFISTSLESIAIYRLTPLHPLAKYPGPLVCRLTKLWGAWVAYKGKPYLYYKDLHERYGPVVRIGPNELSIADAELLPYILGPSGMPKGPMWTGRRILPSKNFNANNSLTAVRDFRRHAELRKPWNNAFKPASIANYEGMLVARAEQFVQKLETLCKLQESNHEPIDLSMWINYFTFDFMGDLAFGGVYSLLRDGDQDEILLKMRRGIFLPSVIHHIPWIMSLIHKVPFLSKDTRDLGAFGIEQARRRVALTDSIQKKDLFYYLLEGHDTPELALRKAVSSSLLAIVAGSDTTSSVLSNLFYYLLSHPEYFQRLRAALDAVFPPSDLNETINPRQLDDLPLLNAVINETLRLLPPIPTSLQRAPALGSGGKTLGDMYIPEGTAILVSPYVLHRNPKYFSPNPDKFWPDRWLSEDPNDIVDRAAFIPFSLGPANCPGKSLAMIELRYKTCLLVRSFDMSFSDGYDIGEWERALVDR